MALMLWFTLAMHLMRIEQNWILPVTRSETSAEHPATSQHNSDASQVASTTDEEDQEQQDTCIICKEGARDYKNPYNDDHQDQMFGLISTSCGHNYHPSCLNQWWKVGYFAGKHRDQLRQCAYCTLYITSVDYHFDYPCGHLKGAEKGAKVRILDNGYGAPKVPPPPPCSHCDRLKGRKHWAGLFVQELNSKTGEKKEYAAFAKEYRRAADPVVYWEQWEGRLSKRLNAPMTLSGGRASLITPAELAFTLDHGHAQSLEHVFRQWWNNTAKNLSVDEKTTDAETLEVIKKAHATAKYIIMMLRWFWKDASYQGFAMCRARLGMPRSYEKSTGVGSGLCQGCNNCSWVTEWFRRRCEEFKGLGEQMRVVAQA